MAKSKKKAKVAPDLSNEDILDDDDKDGGWKEHDSLEAGSQEFDISDKTDDISDGLDDIEDSPDLEEDPKNKKKVAKKPKEDEEEDLLEEEDEDLVDSDEEEEDQEDLDEEEDEDDDELSAPDDPGDFLSPWERKNYSKAMANRVTRERRLKRDAEDATAKEQAARIDAETRAVTAEKVALDMMSEKNEQDIATQKAAIVAAKEEGDTEAEVEATSKLQEALIKKAELSRTAEAQKKRHEQAAATVKQGDGKVAPPSPQLKRWIERNRWFTDPEFMDEEGYARSIDAALSIDPAFSNRAGTPAYFAELDRRIHKKMPGLRNKIKKVFGTRPSPKTAGVGRGTRSNTRVHKKVTRSNRVILTAEDIANAKEYGITTNEGLKEYARNKHRREQEELANQRG